MKSTPDYRYPNHIYDPLRRQIAIELVEKELAKLLPSSMPANISQDVKTWWDNPAEFKMAEVIDFWNAVDAVVGSIKLKSITTMITASNFKWSAARVNVKDIVLLSKMEQLNRLPELTDAPVKLGNVEQLLSQNSAERAEQKRIVDSFSKDKSQNTYRIIAGIAKDGSINVQDGNRRALRALLYDCPQIDAWVYKNDGQQPQDYWVPVSFMIKLVKIYRHNKENARLASSLKAVLMQIFKESSVANVAYQQRVIGSGVKGARELLE